MKKLFAHQLSHVIVTTEQMSKIEKTMFEAGMPVAALMEKAATRVAFRFEQLYPVVRRVGVLVGPGHNGGDALVTARELYLRGYQVLIYAANDPTTKDLTSQHSQYAKYLALTFTESIESLLSVEVIIDGLFGYGLNRVITGALAELIHRVNQANLPIISIDLPSGIQGDTGATLGVAIKATRTICLGLWKPAHFQDQAIEALGEIERIDLGIPPETVWREKPSRQIMTETIASSYFPLPRSPLTHKYQQGHLLLICGSRRYAGSAILTALGARATGVGMLSIAVPASLKSLLISHIPEALVIECQETENGAIANLPPLVSDLSQYNTIACGPGLTLEACGIIPGILESDRPLIIDADGLNNLAQLNMVPLLSQRKAITVLTPHLGEFKRLFPQINEPNLDRMQSVRMAAVASGAIVLFKGARTVISDSSGTLWCLPYSTPALARGGSGDVLTGILGGLVAQTTSTDLTGVVATGAWWHAKAAVVAAKKRTELGVDPMTLAESLLEVVPKIT